MSSTEHIAEREAQLKYWKEHSSEPTVEAMMLDSKAAEIDQLERPEVLKTLGSVENKQVVELGAGIGRFTGELAKTARSVIAIDFMEQSIQQNREANSRFKNCEFQVGDVTELKLDSASCDVVFSNWLLMYLSDDEVRQFAGNALQWLRPEGVVFFRESCFKQSGDLKRKDNPTHYRNPRLYFEVFDAVEETLPDGRYAYYELVNCKCIDTYVKVKKNQNQICWKWQKVVSSTPRAAHLRHFLDGSQYTNNGILRYERIFGPGFVSTGGIDTTRELTARLDLRPGQQVLDIGCGIGGGDFFLASEYGVHVHGLDLSVNMVLTALDRAVDRQGDVTFEIADATTREFDDASFDVVYSRDTLLHVHQKPELFRRIMKMLRPGGNLMITDYCKSEKDETPEFAEYIKQRGYDLHSVPRYGELLQEAGFVDVVAEDVTHKFQESLTKELTRFEVEKDAFVADFSLADYNDITEGWKAKLGRVEAGQQCWGLFIATKPAQSP